MTSVHKEITTEFRRLKVPPPRTGKLRLGPGSVLKKGKEIGTGWSEISLETRSSKGREQHGKRFSSSRGKLAASPLYFRKKRHLIIPEIRRGSIQKALKVCQIIYLI